MQNSEMKNVRWVEVKNLGIGDKGWISLEFGQGHPTMTIEVNKVLKST